MLLLFYLCFAATPDFNSHSVRRQSVTTVSCVIWWVTSLTDLGAELRLKGSLFHIPPSPSEFKSKLLQASHLREKNGETGVICRPVAATGQLVGHCIGGKVSSRLHLQWPGTPGTPAATTALGAKSVASCTYSGQEHQKHQQLHVHRGKGTERLAQGVSFKKLSASGSDGKGDSRAAGSLSPVSPVNQSGGESIYRSICTSSTNKRL